MNFKLGKFFIRVNEVNILALAAVLLCFPAFFINLGITPVIEDEAIRGLVSLEMMFSGDYITPTIGGSYYYNKPPLFNWLVIQSFRTGGYNEFMLRLPTVISMLLFAFTIFCTVRKHLGNQIALTAALMFLTCGRILTYDSLKGLIDIVFSWVLFINFIVLYNGIRKRNYISTFLLSYFLLAIAFMLKGLPAIVFQVFTLITILYISEKWNFIRILLSYKHMLGVVLFILLLGSYYLLYFKQNPESLRELISVTFNQSTRRTALRHGILASMKHLITYPFEFIGHFLPYTILVVYFFKKGSRFLLANNFIKTCIWAFILNITIYWFSPESFARYVFMVVPMLYVVLAYLFQHNAEWKFSKFLYYLFLAFFLLFTLSAALIPFLKATSFREHAIPKTMFLVISLLITIYYYLRSARVNMLVYTAIVLLIVRIGFDWFVLTHRVDNMEQAVKRTEAKKIGKFAKNHTVYVYGEPFKFHDEDAKSKKYISFLTRFYISAESHKTITNSGIIMPDCYYLVREKDIEGKPHVDYSHIGITKDKEPRFLVKFK